MNNITPVTRRHILEGILSKNWFGNLSEPDFLDRIFDLHNLPSSDGRFKDMYGDIVQHRVNNDDYEDSWFITDQRLNILNTSDEKFIAFITQMMHPEIIDPGNRDYFLSLCNRFLINDGFELFSDGFISGEPIYTIQKTSHEEVLRNWLFRLQDACIKISTTGGFSESEYTAIKQSLKKERALYQLLPEFIHFSNQTNSVRLYMQNKATQYAERRQIIIDSFAPAFQYLDNLEKRTNTTSETLIPFPEWEIIGHGGFGVVYKAKHKLLDVPFAIKVLNPSPFSIGKNDTARFFKEAKILFSLNHPNIIRIYDVGMIDEKPYIKMEYFSGENLNNVLCRIGRLTPSKALELVKAVSSGLQYAFNSFHIVHRDLKPSNIMVAKPSIIKVIDFGLGVYLEDDLNSRLTKTGEIVASGVYSSPWLLKEPKMINPVCDIYSLGAIWYECLMGRVPQGVDVESNLTAEKEIPDEHKILIIKCLQTNQDKCFKSWNEFCSCLESIY